MTNHNENHNIDEIDLNRLFSCIWRGKIFIISLSIVFIFFASMHLQTAERKYTVEYKLKPVGENQQDSSFANFGGFASFAGFELPSNSNNDFKIFKELISSVEVSEMIFANKEIIKNIYAKEWDTSLNDFSAPPKGKFQTLIEEVKRTLTGDIDESYMPPSPKRLAIFISKNIKIIDEKETGFLSIKAETSKPDILLSLIISTTEASDQIMRQRYINFSTEPLAFYKEKLTTSRSREHREALAELIGKEEQKLMFASRGKYFTAEPYINPTISFYPTAPKPMLILLLSLIIGLFTGCGMVLIRAAIAKDNS